MGEHFWLSFFGWCSAINLGILVWWFAFIILAPQWVFRLHTRWFALSQSQFFVIHYTGIMVFKLLWLMFNLAPYLTLRFLVS